MISLKSVDRLEHLIELQSKVFQSKLLELLRFYSSVPIIQYSEVWSLYIQWSVALVCCGRIQDITELVLLHLFQLSCLLFLHIFCSFFFFWNYFQKVLSMKQLSENKRFGVVVLCWVDAPNHSYNGVSVSLLVMSLLIYINITTWA